MYESQNKLSRGLIRTGDSQGQCRRSRWRREKLNGPSIFISKTYQILESDNYNGVVCWNQEGTNFTILDVDRFQQQILPIYFRHRNFSSFVRQLNMYDFHKIRNEQNRNIFEHKQFRRDAKNLLRNIKRKGCSAKKNLDQRGSSSEEESDYQEMEDKNQTPRQTLVSIGKPSQGYLPSQPVIPIDSPRKIQALQDFLSGLPEVVSSEQEVKDLIKGMKHNPRFQCLNSRQDVRRIIHRIRRKMVHVEEDGLEELSIEEQIMVHNVDDHEQRVPTLAVLYSDNFLPPKSISFIGSLVLCEELTYPRR